MHGEFISHSFQELLEEERILVGVMKQWNGERLKIYFYWASIFMMSNSLTLFKVVKWKKM